MNGIKIVDQMLRSNVDIQITDRLIIDTYMTENVHFIWSLSTAYHTLKKIYFHLNS
jgi:hypothetical protein